MNLTHARGRVLSGLEDVIATPSGPVSGNPIAIYNHSATNAPTEASGIFLPAVLNVTQTLVDQGYVVIAPQAPASYGNDDSVAAAEAAIDFAVEELGADIGEGVTLYGVSMGTLSAQRYILDGTRPVRRTLLFLQVTDLLDVYDNNTGGFKSAIATAWDIDVSDPLPADGDLLDRIGNSVPILSNYASDDVLSTVSLSEWLTNTEATAHDRGALGHTNAVIAASDLSEIAAFVRP